MRFRRNAKTVLGLVVAAALVPGAQGAPRGEETRVYLDPCEPGKPVGHLRLFSLVKPALISNVIDLALGALTAAASEKNFDLSPGFPANGWLYHMDASQNLQLNPAARCITVLTGVFGSTDAMAFPRHLFASPQPDLDALLSYAKDKNLPAPRVAWRARLDADEGVNDDLYLRLTPLSFLFAGPAHTRWNEFWSRERSVAVTLSLATPEAEAGKAFASVKLAFGGLKEPTFLDARHFADQSSGRFTPPALTKAEAAWVEARMAAPPSKPKQPELWTEPPEVAAKTHRLQEALCAAVNTLNAASKTTQPVRSPHCPSERRAVAKAEAELNAWLAYREELRSFDAAAPTATDAKPKDLRAFIVSASVAETRAASRFLGFLAKVGTDAKPGLMEKIKADTPAAAASAAEAGLKAGEAAMLAKAEADLALAQWQAAEDAEKPAKWLSVLQKRVAANQAARVAGQAAPFPGVGS